MKCWPRVREKPHEDFLRLGRAWIYGARVDRRRGDCSFRGGSRVVVATGSAGCQRIRIFASGRQDRRRVLPRFSFLLERGGVLSILSEAGAVDEFGNSVGARDSYVRPA